METSSLLSACHSLLGVMLAANLVTSYPTPGSDLSSSKCSHKFPAFSELPHGIQLSRQNSRSKRSTLERMKIKVFYHSSVDELDSTKRRIVTEKVVPDAVKYWENIFKVVDGRKRIKLNRKCENNQYFLSPGESTQYCRNKCVETKCGEWIVPEDHLESCSTCDSNGRHCKTESNGGDGVANVDFLLYVSAVDTRQCKQNVAGKAETVAYAAHCQQELDLDRPVAGHTNICPESISTSARDIASLTSTLKHELLHALGFSSSLFAFFRDENGNPRTPRDEDGKPPINQELLVRQWSDSTIKETTRDWAVRSGTVQRKFHLMVTPNVVREVRDHFNCSELEGAELEDQGGDGTALTHWEKRLFQNEAMTGTVHTDNPIYSRITLALMEDSGWYVPDYSKADELRWGRNAGCDFALKSCKYLMEKTEGTAPFCSTPMDNSERTYCTEDGSSVGSCNLVEYDSEIPDIYQNFDSIPGVRARDIGKMGSSVILADFCPYVQEFSWLGGGGAGGTDDPRGTRCDNSDNSPESDSNFALESYGRESICVKQEQEWEQKSCTMVKKWSRYGSGCYKHVCADGKLNIVVRNITFACYENGQKIPIQLVKGSSDGDWIHEGMLTCPSCSSLCADCSKVGRELKNHYEKREDLGDCLEKAVSDDPLNDLVGFLSEFNFKFG